MPTSSEDKNFSPMPNQLLGSLARELKNPLILVARQAELEGLNLENPVFDSIRRTAEQALKLIDSYLLMARSEYGQQALPLQAVGIGSIVYDVAQELKYYKKSYNFELISEVKDVSVMAHPEGLKTALWCLAQLAIGQPNDETIQKTRPMLRIYAKKHADLVNVSVLSNRMKITRKDISRAREIQGKSHLSLSTQSPDSGIRLAIADLLASSIGNGLEITRAGGLKGIGFDLLASRQLQLV